MYFCWQLHFKRFTSPVLNMPLATPVGFLKYFGVTWYISSLLWKEMKPPLQFIILFYWASLILSSKCAPHMLFSVWVLRIAVISNLSFSSSFLGSSSFSHTWTFIRKQLRFWRFIQKTYYLCMWWGIIQLTLCCKKIWSGTQRKTFWNVSTNLLCSEYQSFVVANCSYLRN